MSANGPADQIPLLVAAENGHVDIIQLLIAHGATVNTQVEKFIIHVWSLVPRPSGREKRPGIDCLHMCNLYQDFW